jgi:hypothetical protein
MLGTNGKVVTEADWIERREEIKDLMQYYWYGWRWDTPVSAFSNVTATYGGTAAAPTIAIRATINNANDPLAVANGIGHLSVTDVLLGTFTLPTEAQVEASPFSFEAGLPSASGGNAAQFRNFGIASLAIGAVTPYNTLFPQNLNNTYLHTAVIMRTGWVFSALITALEILNADPETYTGINPYGIASLGVSMGGKTAHMNAIWDDRMAVSVPVESGGGGLFMDRGLTEGRINIFRGNQIGNNPNGGSGSGFASRPMSRQQKHINSTANEANPLLGNLHRTGLPGVNHYTPMYLPFDAHLSIALMAPSELYNPNRAIVAICNTAMGSWIAPPQQEMNMQAAKKVWDFLGSTTITNINRNGAHAVQGRDTPYVIRRRRGNIQSQAYPRIEQRRVSF